MRLSVVIPTYNTPQAILERCVASVRRATNDCDEIILVDDCSTKHREALDVVRDRFNVRLTKLSTNGGQAVARNVGLKESTGEFVAFVDSDDEIHEDIYERCIQVARQGVDIVVYGVRTVWPRLGIEKLNFLKDQVYGQLDAEALKLLCDHCLFMYPWNKIYRKKFLIDNMISFEEMCVPREDEVFNLSCVLHGAQWANVSEIGHVYYHQDGSSLGRYRRYNHESNRRVAESWVVCRQRIDPDGKVLGNRGVVSPRSVFMSDWRNMWRHDAPFSPRDKWNWLVQHSGATNVFRHMWSYVWMAAWVWARGHLYFRWFQQRHVLKLYPYARRVDFA